MKKIIYLSSGLLLGLASPIDAMHQPQNPAVIAIHVGNKAKSQANEAQYKGQPYYTLFVMQPTTGYRTLNGCVDFLFANNKFPAGYNKIRPQNWHISTIAIAVPFDNPANAQEVNKAAEDLRQIVGRYKRSLAQVAYKFSKLSSIGTHKFIAAHYDFTAGRREFLNAYAKIYRDFLAKYPKAYMYYGYKAFPHISVASAANPGNAVNLNTRQCGRINNVALLHSGRNLHVATGFYNPQTKRIDRNQTQAI